MITISKEDRFKKEMLLNEADGNDFYLVLSVNPNSLKLSEENDIYIYPEYALSVKKTSEPIEYGIPILKIKNNDSWEIDKNFIPPSTTLNSVESLLHKYLETNNLINKILGHFPTNNPFGLHLNLLRFELNDFNSKKSPEEWSRVMKKFCWIFYSHLRNENKIAENNNMKSFIEEMFNPNEIGRIFHLGLGCFQEIFSFFDQKDEIEEIKL
jgi:hypothetical protein